MIVHFSKAINGSTVARIYRPGSEMLIFIPEFVTTRSQGFSSEEQEKILNALKARKNRILKVAQLQNFEIDIEIQ